MSIRNDKRQQRDKLDLKLQKVDDEKFLFAKLSKNRSNGLEFW